MERQPDGPLSQTRCAERVVTEMPAKKKAAKKAKKK
jgi:hypothetical protein